jgi:membrane-associated protease RseP (regulator of RpoE activity)
MSTAPNGVELFEVNLISDQISTLLRRKAFEQLAGVATVLMIFAGAILAIFMVMHLTTALRMRSGTQSKLKEVQSLERLCADLDSDRARATQRANAVAPLLPIARQRVAWAPKLAAVAAALPPGTGIVSIQASQRDVFIIRAPAAKSAGLTYAAQDAAGLPQMSIAILCTTLGAGEETLDVFTERLKKDAAFMDKFDSIEQAAMEQDQWAGKPVEVLHIHAQGTPR